LLCCFLQLVTVCCGGGGLVGEWVVGGLRARGGGGE